MELIFLFFLIDVFLGWSPILSPRIIKSIDNENIIIQEDYLIIAEGSFSITYSQLQGYRELYLMFDAKTNKSGCEVLVIVNGVRRNIIQVQTEFIEFHMNFKHQTPHVVIQFIFQKSTKIEIRNFNVFVQECPKNCRYCLLGQCELELIESCNKLIYKGQCIEECPDGTIAEYNYCIQASLKEIRFGNSFLHEGLTTIQKFGEEKQVKLNFDKDFKGLLDIVFNCYSQQERNNDQIIKIDLMKGQSHIIYPFLNTYINLQSYQECKSKYDLKCLQFKGQFEIDLFQEHQVKINSYSKKKELTGFWEIESFKIYNKVLETYDCQIQNCIQCSYQNECKQCEQQFYLYQNKCIKKCPLFTIKDETSCIDFDEKQKGLNFLVKLESPFQDLSQIFGGISFDLKEQISFRYENETIFIGGGLLDQWRRTTFSRQINLGRHYAIRIMFNLSIENSTSNQDNFVYSIDGRSFNVYKNISYIDHTLNHNKYILNLNLGCKISSQGRCVISNYYFMTMKCSPLCQTCTGPSQSDCKGYQANIEKFNYQSLKCEDGYYLNDNGCQRCSYGCQLCDSLDKCLKCLNTKEAEFICKQNL